MIGKNIIAYIPICYKNQTILTPPSVLERKAKFFKNGWSMHILMRCFDCPLRSYFFRKPKNPYAGLGYPYPHPWPSQPKPRPCPRAAYAYELRPVMKNRVGTQTQK